MKTINSISFLTIFLIIFFSAISHAQGWLEYINREDLFIVNFPGKPEVRETAHRSAFEAIFPARVYTVEKDSSIYSLTVVDYRESEKIHSERTDRTEANSSNSVWVTDVRASVAHAAQGFRSMGGEVTYDAWSDIEKIEGHQLQITNLDQSRSFIGIYLHKTKLYILEARVPKGYPPQGHFQQSLSFLDEQGDRIRYDFAEDGSLVRCCREWR